MVGFEPAHFLRGTNFKKVGCAVGQRYTEQSQGEGLRLIGTRTFGKGLIHTVERLADGSSLVITVGRMYTLEGQGSLGTRNRTRQSFDAGSQKSAYVGRELHVDGSLEVERHLRECAECSPAYDDMGLLQRSLRSDELRYQPSADLTKQVRANLRHFRAEILL